MQPQNYQPDHPLEGAHGWSENTAEATAPSQVRNRACLKPSLDSIINLSTDWWLIELLSWVLAAVCVACIAGMLAFYDRKPLPSTFPLGLTLNAYISVLSAIAKLALAVPLEEALGAQKYLWFSTGVAKRPVIDFEKFDDAARGPIGAIRLLCRTRARSLGTIGGTIFLLTLALDPSFQQLVAFPKRASLINRSRLPRVVEFKKQNLVQNNGTEGLGYSGSMNDAVATFFVNQNTLAPIAAYCSNEECTWPVFDTLGVCSQCENIADMIDHGCRNESGDWRIEYGQQNDGNSSLYLNQSSCGWFFNITSEKPLLMSGYPANIPEESPLADNALIMRLLNLRDPFSNELYWNTTLRFPDVPAPITNFAIVAASDLEAVHQNKTPQAYNCVMRWCTKTISSSFSQGILNERVLSIFTNDTQIPDPLVVQWLENSYWDYEYTQNISITPPGQSETFAVTNLSAIASRFTMDNWAPSMLTHTNLSTLPLLRYLNDYPPGPSGHFAEMTNATTWISTRKIPDVMDDIAEAMTNALRNNKLYSQDVLGSGVPEIFVQVQWVWFAFPLGILVVTLIFLLITIWQTSGSYTLWKSSSLTVLTHGLSWDAKYAFREARSMRQIRARAKEVYVHLNLDKEAGTLDVNLEKESCGTWDEKFVVRYLNS